MNCLTEIETVAATGNTENSVTISALDQQVLNIYANGQVPAATFEYTIENGENLLQYMVLIQTTNFCEQVRIKFENYDTVDNTVSLGNFCGRSTNKCEFFRSHLISENFLIHILLLPFVLISIPQRRPQQSIEGAVSDCHPRKL